MAHESTNVGTASELRAMMALLANGYVVAEPVTLAEVFDIVAKEPGTGDWKTYQVKTARRREDRDGAIVLMARRGNGEVYTREDCDYLIAVLDNDVYIVENREIGEYWVTPENIAEKWRKLEYAREAV